MLFRCLHNPRQTILFLKPNPINTFIVLIDTTSSVETKSVTRNLSMDSSGLELYPADYTLVAFVCRRAQRNQTRIHGSTGKSSLDVVEERERV